MKTATILRDGTTTPDPRLGCLFRPDDRNRDYPITAVVRWDREPVSRRWQCTQAMNQGEEGCCVAMGIAHELFTPPAVLPETVGVDWCVTHLYWPAQQKDPWPGGGYPGALPRYEGTSLEAGLKVARHDLKLCTGYHWARTVRQVLVGIGHYRPAILALPWRESMSRPERSGQVRYRGPIIGGHCLLADEVKLPRWPWQPIRIGLQQSWGRAHGIDGRVWMTEDDLALALADGGQAAFLEGRQQVDRL
jgi:hypothetical protein